MVAQQLSLFSFFIYTSNTLKGLQIYSSLQMRVLIALLLLVCSFGVPPQSTHRFIVFTHDGTFYKLDPETKQVQWHNQLPFKLLSMDINLKQQPENETKKLFIPTIDGDFIYFQRNIISTHPKQILVPREDVEHLLDMCFDNRNDEKYFVYQNLQYFVLNTQNGQFTPLQGYLNKGLIFNRNIHTIIIVAKKLLKQLNQNMEVKWSVISSKIALVSIEQFINNNNNKINQPYVHHQKYSFLRVDQKTIQILDQNKLVIFEIQASSTIMNIFSEDQKTHKVSKILIQNVEHKLLAITQFHEGKPSQIHKQIVNMDRQTQKTFQSFPSSKEIQDRKLSEQDENHLLMCIKTHKILKEASLASSQAKIFGQRPKFIYGGINHQQINFNFNPEDLPTIPYSSDRPIHITVNKQQPFVYIFLVVIIISGFIFYRFKVNKLLQYISQVQNTTDENIKKFTAKLGEYQNVGKQLKKMYEINWSSILYQNSIYFVFQGRFLNQNAQVFVLPLQGFDIIDIQHKLNILINCSHKCITKLYYYTKNQDSLLIFCEKNPSLTKLKQIAVQKPQIYQKFSKNDQSYKNCIKTIIDSILQVLNEKIQISLLTQQSVLISDNLDLKINIIPSFLHKNIDQQEKKFKQIGTTKLRVDIIKIIHKMGHKGSQFDLVAFEKQKNTNSEQDSFLKDFYNHFILTEDFPQDIDALRNCEKHPFLWDSKQKMLYVCDFSNYVQTCIDQSKINKMQSHCRNYQIIPFPWNHQLHPTLVKQINYYRKYDFNSARDLIRLIRNKLSHFHQIPKQTRAIIGKTPEQFVEHFSQRFPKLLPFMYAYATKKKWKLNANN